MKKILLFFAAAACAIASWAQTGATVSATVKSQTLEVALTNESEDFVAFQMDITLPEGVTVADNGAVALVADRLTQPGTSTTIAGEAASLNFNIAYNQVDATHVRVLAYNLQNRAIAGKAGALFNVTFAGTPAANFELSNVKFVTVSDLEEVDLDAVQSTVGADVLLGDVDHSGEVDPLDLACMVDILLAKADKVAEADLDGNGDVDPLDMSLLIDILLGK